MSPGAGARAGTETEGQGMGTANTTDPDFQPSAKGRVRSIDLLRGVVMVLMVLDHTRDFVAPLNLDPTDAGQSSPALFATRWVTHFCAPVFVLLAGVSAGLGGAGGAARARRLAVRGLWLIVLELTIAKFGLFFNLAPGIWPLIVLWAIGWSLIGLAALIAVGLPPRVIAALGLLLIAGHNLADGVRAETLGAFRPLWLILHEQGPIILPVGAVIFVAYPLIPWVGVMAAGYGLAEVWGPGWTPPRRRRFLAAIGLVLLVLFGVLRGFNLYGDPDPWSPRAEPVRTVMSFLDCQKYPPSLLYLAMTLGPALLLLAAVDGRPLSGPAGRILRTLGRVPLFFYVLQWYVIHTLAVLLALAEGNSVRPFFEGGPFDLPADYTHSLPAVYAAWLLTLAIMYPICRWYGARRHGGPADELGKLD